MSILSADLNFFSFVLTFKPAVEARLGWSWCSFPRRTPPGSLIAIVLKISFCLTDTGILVPTHFHRLFHCGLRSLVPIPVASGISSLVSFQVSVIPLQTVHWMQHVKNNLES